MQRVETGPLQFDDDWPGVFIRGDNALYYGTALMALLKKHSDESDIIGRAVLQGLAETLMSCDAHHGDIEDLTRIERK